MGNGGKRRGGHRRGDLLAAAPKPGEPDRPLGTFDKPEDQEGCRVRAEAELVRLGMQRTHCIHAKWITLPPDRRGRDRPVWIRAVVLHAYTMAELKQLTADRELLRQYGGSSGHGLRPGRGTP